MEEEFAATHKGGIRGSSKVLLVVGMILLAANLRAAITGVGPLVSVICSDTGLSNTLVGMLTTLPLLAFTIFSPIAPMIARRISIEYTLVGSLAVLTIGTVCRCFGGQVGLFVGMFLAGVGIAMGNVLLPSLVKRDFPQQIGLLTGVYSVSMNVCAALGSGLSVPLSKISGFGWKGSLMSWAALTLIALIIWLPLLRNRHLPNRKPTGLNLWKSGLAWQVTLFMGLQSLTFYVNVAWLPQLLQDRGMSAVGSGWMVSLMQLVSLPASFIVPVIAGKRPSQRQHIVWIAALFLIGYVGFLSGGLSLAWLWIILIGVAGGASISLALALFGLRTHTSDEAAQLSGMAQSIGYLLAGIGPLVIGYLHGVTGSWTIPLVVVIVDVLLMFVFGLGAGRNAFVNVSHKVGMDSVEHEAS